MSYFPAVHFFHLLTYTFALICFVIDFKMQHEAMRLNEPPIKRVHTSIPKAILASNKLVIAYDDTIGGC